MHLKSSLRKYSDKLTFIFLAWLALLVTNSVIAGSTNFAQTGWTALVYWSIDGVAAIAVTTAAILAWRYGRRYDFSIMLAFGAVAYAAAHLLGRSVLTFTWSHSLAMVSHLLVATITLGFVFALVTAVQLPAAQRKSGTIAPSHQFYFSTILLTGVSFLILLATGSVVSQTGAGLACADWPLCQGELVPTGLNMSMGLNLLHRFTTIAFGVLVAAVVLQTRRHYSDRPLITRWSNILGLILIAQVLVGGLYPLLGPVFLLTFAHLALTAVIWGSLVVLATICYLTLDTPLVQVAPPVNEAPLTRKEKVLIYFKLTKPWIMILLLLTTLTAMFIAAEGVPSMPLILLALLGGAMSSGGASVLNSYIDADIDRIMSRTSRRATVTGLVSAKETLIFGLVLSTLSFLLFAVFVNTLSALLSTLGILYYVFFYTLYLKRTTIHNIIIGGAAGAIPPLVGWAAVNNGLDLSAFYLFAIIFFWTPPHTWALTLMVEKDYAKAYVPMLPVIIGEKETTYQIFLYSVLLITLTLLPFTFGMLSWVYFTAAVLLGVRFLQLAWQVWRNYDKAVARKLYKYSQAYLAVLFLVMAIDRVVF